MGLSDEILLLISARNTSGPVLDSFQKQLDVTKSSVAGLSLGMKDLGSVASSVRLEGSIAGLDAMAASADRATLAIRSQIVAMGDLALVSRTTASATAASSLENTVAGAVGGRGGGGLALRTGLGGLSQSGGFNLGAGGAGIAGGSGVLGTATIPVVVAAVAGYLGIKAVGVANQYNQTIADVVAASSQNAALIPALQQGILNLAGGQNRFTPQQLATAAYPIASTPAFGNTSAAFLNAASVISQQAQPYGAAALPALAQADTGAFNAFHLSTQKQFADIADIIAKGVNVGAAEPSDFAKGVGTFAPSAYAAGLTGVGGLAQAAGAFAQGSLLNPRFRFDAQGLNALFQQVTGKQTAGAAQAESNLGISNLFGVGAIAAAGGLPQWLQQLQTATAGPNQQNYLQAIFTRQNALQAARGLTGQNFGSGQEQIAKVRDYSGTVATGARIADSGPQAQFDQIQSTFNKDVIEVGNTISKTLNPDLLILAKGLENASGKVGDFLGAMGDGIDHWNAWLNQRATIVNLPAVPGQLGNAISTALGGAKVPAGFSGGVLHPGQSADPNINLPGSGARLYLPTASGGVGVGAGSGSSEWYNLKTGVVAAVPTLTGGGGPTYTQPLTGGGGPTYEPAQLGQAQIQAGLQGIAQANAVQAQVAINQAKENAALAARNPANTAQLLQDRGSINYDLQTGASNKALDAALAKLKTDLGTSGMDALNQRNYLQKYSQPVTNVENQRLVDAATMQFNAAQLFSESVQVHHGSIAQQQQAINQQYTASVHLADVTKQTGGFGKGAVGQQGYQDAILQAQNARFQGNGGLVQEQFGRLQDKATLVGLQGNTALQQNYIAAAVAYMQSHAQALGLTATQASIEALQLEAQNKIVPAIREQLIRPNVAGIGAPVNAGYGQSEASLSVPTASVGNQQLAAALRTISYLEQELSTTKAQLKIAQQSDAKLGVLVAQNAKAAQHSSAPNNTLHGLGTPRPRPN